MSIEWDTESAAAMASASSTILDGDRNATVEHIREVIGGCIGARVRVRVDMGRSTAFERDCRLLQSHASLFVVETVEKRGRKMRRSYQYADVIDGTVELFDPESGQPVFPELQMTL